MFAREQGVQRQRHNARTRDEAGVRFLPSESRQEGEGGTRVQKREEREKEWLDDTIRVCVPTEGKDFAPEIESSDQKETIHAR
jgi:hypothetical protein